LGATFWAAILSILLILIVFTFSFVCNIVNFTTLIGCFPIFYMLMFYVSYGVIIGLGTALLIMKDLKLDLLLYTIFQMATGIVIFTNAIYRLCLKKQL
jgi:hypothetical protein